MLSVPPGKAGKAFVGELELLLRSYADGSALEVLLLISAVIMPQLLCKTLAQKIQSP